MKTNLTRRTVINGGTALATAGTLTGSGLLAWTKAWAQGAPWKPERNAQLTLLRWKHFVRAEDETFMAALDAFTKPTGVRSRLLMSRSMTFNPKPRLRPTSEPDPICFGAFFHCPTCFRIKALM
jgi:multiple sugar transport system substrate-binding protein